MDRLAAFFHWRDRQALDQAVALARAHPIDLEAVGRWSRAEGRRVEFDEFVQAYSQS
jgi:hypothetical protein